MLSVFIVAAAAAAATAADACTKARALQFNEMIYTVFVIRYAWRKRDMT